MKEQWEAEFDRKFTDSPSLEIGWDNVKDFIRSLLASQRETLAAEIQGLKKELFEANSKDYLGRGYNIAIADAAAHIRNSK